MNQNQDFDPAFPVEADPVSTKRAGRSGGGKLIPELRDKEAPGSDPVLPPGRLDQTEREG